MAIERGTQPITRAYPPPFCIPHAWATTTKNRIIICCNISRVITDYACLLRLAFPWSVLDRSVARVYSGARAASVLCLHSITSTYSHIRRVYALCIWSRRVSNALPISSSSNIRIFMRQPRTGKLLFRQSVAPSHQFSHQYIAHMHDSAVARVLPHFVPYRYATPFHGAPTLSKTIGILSESITTIFIAHILLVFAPSSALIFC